MRRRRMWIAGAVALAVLVITGGVWALTRDSSESDSVHAATARGPEVTNAPSLATTEPPTTASPTTVPPPPAPPTPPSPAGPPYPVGVSHFTLVDPSRETAALGGDPGAPDRTLPVTLHYPSAGAETEGASPAAGQFPLVVFAHGFDISAADYDAFTSELAAQGFIVAAPDFPLSSTSPPGPVTQDDIDNQARDVSFLLSSLPSSMVPSEVRSHIAPGDAGVVGHSDGGNTAARVASNSCCFDARIGAAVILSGDEGQTGGSWAVPGAAPMLLLQGTADTINPWSLTQRLYDDAAAPKWLVAINGAEHLAPYTNGPQRGAIVALVADFLRARLQDPSAMHRVLDEANQEPLSLVASG